MSRMIVCRVCLSTEQQNLLPLDDTFVNNYNLLTNLNINLLDGMPQNSCRTCLDTVKSYIEFREKSILAEETLRELVFDDFKTERKLSVVDIDIPTTYGDDDFPPVKSEIKEEVDDSIDHYDVPVEYIDNLDTLLVKKDEDDVPPKKLRKKQTDTKPTKNVGKKQKAKKATKNIRKKPTDKNPKLKEKLEFNLEKEWICGICPKKFADRNELNKHLDIHKSTRVCLICEEQMNSLSQLLTHRLSHVPGSQKKCHICDRNFKSSIYLEFHYRNLHIEEDDKKIQCNQCPQKCSNPKRLNCHIRNVHSEVKYVCDTCSKGFRCKANLKSHIKTHATNKIYVCDLCGFSCKIRHGLMDHKIRKHMPEKVYCKQCKRPFPNQLAHDKHKCTSILAICSICGKQVKGSNSLSRHMTTHTDVQKYECTRCPAKYKCKAALIAHTERHDNNPTKQCEFCPAKFFSASVLVKHRRIHTGEKPYVCEICSKGFTGRHNYKVHMKVHGEYLVVKRNSVKQEDLTNVAK